MKKISIFLLAFSLIFASCTKNKEPEVVEPKWTPVTEHVAVLFGYGYNEDDFVNKITSDLSEEFGLESENGLVLPLVFPKDFIVSGSVGRISNLTSIIKEKNCKGLVILGAPEYTHRTLAQIQDENIDCTVISMFTQDDVLGTESGSYLVFDFVEEELSLDEGNEAPKDEETQAEIESQLIEDMLTEEELKIQRIESIVMNVVKVLKNPEEMKSLSYGELFPKLFSPEWEVSSFLDTSTGLKSHNHFVLKYIEPVIQEEPEEKKEKRGFWGRKK